MRRYVRLLDAPLGNDGMTLHDVLAGQPAVDLTFEGFKDLRLIELLGSLTADERAVAMWHSRRGITNWVEAAMAAGPADRTSPLLAPTSRWPHASSNPRCSPWP
ncbi:hypothetical protein [Streptomyces virginiae]|uniref:hypothetical protein n=1 Tax=Streptomyces virginiae TaxID=1961 RepID=UPI0036F07CFD